MLGWIVVGNINFLPSAQNTKVICRLVRNQELNESLQKFWEIEHCFTKSNTQCLSKTEFADMVCKRLLSMEKRMSKNAELPNQYVAFMDEYE